MKRAGEFLRRFGADETGAASVEYALLAALVFGGIILDADALRTEVADAAGASARCIDVAPAAGC